MKTTYSKLVVTLSAVCCILISCQEDPFINAPGDNSFNAADKTLADSSFIDPVDDLDIPDEAITVKEAIELCKKLKAGETDMEHAYYVYGFVSSYAPDAATIAQYGNANFYMKDHVTDIEHFYCFQLYGLNKQPFTSVDEIVVGNRVVVCVHLCNFRGTTWETAGKGDGYIYSTTWKEPVIETTGSGTFDSPYTIADLMKLGSKKVSGMQYVRGYIIGTNNNTEKFAEEYLNIGDDLKTYNFVMADTPSATDIHNMIPIQLGTKNALRPEINLKDHPENLGKEVVVYGNISTSYLKVLGMDDIKWIKIGNTEYGSRE